jgi:hypothetical protein
VPPNRIDIHAHYFGGAANALFGSGFRLVGDYGITVETGTGATLTFIRPREIITQLVSAPWPAAGTPGELLGDGLVSDHPQRFGAFAAVPASVPDEALTEITYAPDGQTRERTGR